MPGIMSGASVGGVPAAADVVSRPVDEIGPDADPRAAIGDRSQADVPRFRVVPELDRRRLTS